MSRDKLAHQMLGIFPLFHRKLLKKYKSTELKRMEFLLLHELMIADGMHMNAYGEKLSISKPNLSKLVHSLEEKKWVRKEKSEEDKRITRIFLTAQGRLVLKSHFELMKNQVIKSTDKLTNDEVETLIVNFESIHRILTKLDDMANE